MLNGITADDRSTAVRRLARLLMEAAVATLIQTAKLNDVDPLAWLTDVLERIVAGRTKRNELASLLPWNWKAAKAIEAPSST